MIVQDGLRRMYAEQEDVFYYLTVMNENYQHPGHAAGPGGRGPRGHHPRHVPAARGAAPTKAKGAPRVQLLGSGTILREVIAAAELLEQDFGVAADVWSVPSFTELRRDGIDTERWNMLHPARSGGPAIVEQSLAGRPAAR